MCLFKSGGFKVNKNYGYKWFDDYRYTMKEQCRLQTPGKHFIIERRGKWIKNDYIDKINYDYQDSVANMYDTYKSGFHIFYNKKEALKSRWNRYGSKLYKVYFRDYVTGYGDGVYGNSYKQIVAQKMKVAELVYPIKKKRKVKK